MGHPRPSGIPGPNHAKKKKIGSHGCVLLNSGDGPVWDPGISAGAGIFFYVLNFDEMI